MNLTFSLMLAGYATGAALAQTIGMVDPSVLANASSKVFHPKPQDLTNGRAHARFGIFGIDSIPNFNDQFFADGVDFNNNPNRHWYTNTVGNPPQMGRTTLIGAPVQPVDVELDDANGNLMVVNGHPMISSATPFVAPTLASPVFSNFLYSSGPDPTQFSDAVQRAQYFNQMKPDWHTLLAPTAKTAVTMRLRQSPNCSSVFPFKDCTYVFSLNPGEICCRFILVNDVAFANAFFGVIVGDIANNAITTKDISSFLFPNVFLFSQMLMIAACSVFTLMSSTRAGIWKSAGY